MKKNINNVGLDEFLKKKKSKLARNPSQSSLKKDYSEDRSGSELKSVQFHSNSGCNDIKIPNR